MSNDVKALISHYARLGFSRHIQTVCDEVIKKRGRDGTLVFWHAFSSIMEGVSSWPLRCIARPPVQRCSSLAFAFHFNI
jgi:tetratricopeptide repeat protein 21B